jgi:hypothetical protein
MDPGVNRESKTITITRNQYRFADFMTDVLVYTIVLNLFVEYSDAIIIDSFTLSILTAVLLKLLLDALVGFEHRVGAWFKARDGTFFRVAGPITVFAILFFSKFLILEIVDLVFGEHVELGHLLDVILLIISMMVARRLVGVIYQRLGTGAEPV